MSNYYVIFDMDGTLLDTQRIHIPAWDLAGARQGFIGCGEHIPAVCGMNENGWSNYLLEHFPGLDLQRFKMESAAYVKAHYTAEFMPGAKELLDWLRDRGVPMAVASGSDVAMIRSNMEARGVSDYFECFVGSESVVNGKPAPDVFLKAAEKLGADPADCIVFEDSPNGIRAAAAAGMKCFGIPDLIAFDEELRSLLTAELKTISDAIPCLEAMNHAM